MRIIAIATFCALAALPAQAQQIDHIKATGANAAGACAGSLEIIGQHISQAPNPDPRRLAEIQQTRDFFADLPAYPASEIAAAANGFIALMVNRLGNASTEAERRSIRREILKVSADCTRSAQPDIRNLRATGRLPAPAQAGAAQPYATQPYIEQPTVIQPYTTQPLVLDPMIPAQ